MSSEVALQRVSLDELADLKLLCESTLGFSLVTIELGVTKQAFQIVIDDILNKNKGDF